MPATNGSRMSLSSQSSENEDDKRAEPEQQLALRC